MNKYYAICIGLGLTSGLMNLSILIGGLPAFVLSFFASFPLFLLGLGWGTPAVVIGAVTGLAATLLAGASTSASYAMAVALPAVIISRQAILAQDDGRGNLQWYPLSNLVLILAGLAGLNLLTAHVFTSADTGGLIGQVTNLVTQFFGALEAQNDNALFAGVAKEEAIERFVRFMLIGLAMAWMFCLVANGALAQEILRRKNKNIRPKADIVDLALPGWLSLLFLATLGAALADGLLAEIALVVVGMLIAAYIMQGLAVLHAFARRFQRPEVWLLLAYALFLLFGWLLGLVILVGVADSWMNFRSRLLPSAPADQNGGGNKTEDE